MKADNRWSHLALRGRNKTFRILRVSAAIIILPAILISLAGASSSNDEQLLKARETVWRAWFAGDIKTLEELVPPETIVMSGGEEKWKKQADVLHSAAEFHAGGGKLVRLEFPRTEIQHSAMLPSYGAAISWKPTLAANDR